MPERSTREDDLCRGPFQICNTVVILVRYGDHQRQHDSGDRRWRTHPRIALNYLHVHKDWLGIESILKNGPEVTSLQQNLRGVGSQLGRKAERKERSPMRELRALQLVPGKVERLRRIAKRVYLFNRHHAGSLLEVCG
jgi:hypothetical protein